MRKVICALTMALMVTTAGNATQVVQEWKGSALNDTIVGITAYVVCPNNAGLTIEDLQVGFNNVMEQTGVNDVESLKTYLIEQSKLQTKALEGNAQATAAFCKIMGMTVQLNHMRLQQ